MKRGKRYGDYYDVALETSVLLTHFVASIDESRWVFGSFLALAKKHHLLALFSTVRLHKVQSMLDLRQTLEAGACAAFAIANPDHSHFVDTDEHGLLDPSQKLTGKRYNWLDKEFPQGSAAIKTMKDQINAATAHANLISAHNVFSANSPESWFDAPFFDWEDPHFVKADLWLIGNAALTLMRLIDEVNEKEKFIAFADSFHGQHQALAQRSEAQRQEMLATERVKSALAKERLRKGNS